MELLRSKIDINAKDQDGATALHHAAFNGSVEICRMLIEKGAKATQKVRGVPPPSSVIPLFRKTS